MNRNIIIRSFLALALTAMSVTGCYVQKKTGDSLSTKGVEVPSTANPDPTAPVVYFTSDISPEGLIKVYEALGITPSGRVAVKISTGESEKSNHLRPDFIKDFVHKVNGTLVECNTAYGGNRTDSESHRKAIAQRGFEAVSHVDIMDEEGEMRLPVVDDKHIKYDIVGSHLQNYDFMVNLAHFKGHEMGGFGGVLKNQSIGVMNNMSVDCDCNGNPAAPRLKDIGILASMDPVALDKACTDLVFTHDDTAGDDAKPLQQRINRQHGLHILEYAEGLGLGVTKYNLVNID